MSWVQEEVGMELLIWLVYRWGRGGQCEHTLLLVLTLDTVHTPKWHLPHSRSGRLWKSNSSGISLLILLPTTFFPQWNTIWPKLCFTAVLLQKDTVLLWDCIFPLKAIALKDYSTTAVMFLFDTCMLRKVSVFCHYSCDIGWVEHALTDLIFSFKLHLQNDLEQKAVCPLNRSRAIIGVKLFHESRVR